MQRWGTAPLVLLALSWTPLVLAQTPIPSAPSIDAASYVLMDYASGRMLAEQDADKPVPPASLVKLMTSFVVFHELQRGTLSLDDEVYISEKAWRTGGSRTFLNVGDKVRLEDLLRGMIVQSGNDASVALSEHAAGSEESFVELMNHWAAELGMTNTHFTNATGLPNEEMNTTAHDMALLSAALIRQFPEYYGWYAEKEFVFNGIPQRNRNSLLFREPSVDGLKTGHTEAAGYCLAASAKRDEQRLISVVMGAPSEDSRADSSQRLLNYGFRFYETHRLYGASEMLEEATVYKGATRTVALGVASDVVVTIARGQYSNLDASVDLPGAIVAPIALGEQIGTLTVRLGDEVVAERPLVALEPVAEGGFWRRMSDSVSLWFAD